MLMRALRVNRRAALAIGAMTVGALAGCQGTGQQFAHPGVARGDAGTPMATSPAFAQVAAGNQMAAGRMNMPINNGMMASPGMAAGNYQMAPGQTVMGSGGMVQPVAYSPSGPTSIPVTQPMPTMPQPVVHQQPVMGTMQPTPAAMPVQMPAGTPTYMIMQGPNGPQYVMVQEVSSAPAAAVPVVAEPPVAAPAAVPAPAPAVVPAATAAPAKPAATTIPAPEPAPAPAPAPPAAPTFSAPPIESVPLPSMPALPTPSDSTSKVPGPLPTSMISKPAAGPNLPAPDQGPSLPNFSAPLAASTTTPSSLPIPVTVSHDDIPEAPVFLPAGR